MRAIELIAPVVIDGSTHYYIGITGSDELFDVDVSDEGAVMGSCATKRRPDQSGLYGKLRIKSGAGD